jgi:hypothetical protein
MSAAPVERDALSRLEDELISIAGLADCLVLIGISRSNDPAFGYLGSQLNAHHDAAREAFDEVFDAAMLAQQRVADLGHERAKRGAAAPCRLVHAEKEADELPGSGDAA